MEEKADCWLSMTYSGCGDGPGPGGRRMRLDARALWAAVESWPEAGGRVSERFTRPPYRREAGAARRQELGAPGPGAVGWLQVLQGSGQAGGVSDFLVGRGNARRRNRTGMAGRTAKDKGLAGWRGLSRASRVVGRV